MMHTLFLLMEIFTFGTVTPGTMLDRSLARKVIQVLQVLPVTLDQPVQQVRLAHLQLTTQLHLHLQKLVTLGLTQLMEKFTSTTIHIGLRLAPHL
jgi:copper homeostasis protein CutC